MNDLHDTRKHVGRTVTDRTGKRSHYALAASQAIFELLSQNPHIEIATLRFHIETEKPPRISVTGRVGSLTPGTGKQPGILDHLLPCCGVHHGRPHTDYCPDRTGAMFTDPDPRP